MPSADVFVGAAAEGRSRSSGFANLTAGSGALPRDGGGASGIAPTADLNMLPVTVIEDPVFIPSVE